MNSDIATAEPIVHYRNAPNGFDDKVTRTLETSFATILSRLADTGKPRSPADITGDPEEVADRLARLLFQFSRAAAAGPPDAEIFSGIRTRLLEFVQTGIPIEAQMLWSPRKHWQPAAESAVDLAELAAFQTLISIDAAVQTFYHAGISFVIDLEDIEFQFMEGQSKEAAHAQETYISGMKSLLNALGLTELFTVRRISEHAKNPEQLGQWREQMAENYRALAAYWHESERRPVSSWESLPSFKEIRQLGWKGTIPPEMRGYYLDRIGRVTDASEAQKVDMVLRNLAGVLLHYQADLLRGSGGVSPIKFSFVHSAAAAPAEFQNGRVNLRFAPRRLCSRVSAAGPWGTKGFLSGRGNDLRVSFRGWHELGDAPSGFSEGWLTLAGPNGSARIRADFRREDED